MTRHSPQSQVALIGAFVVALVGAGLLVVLIAGLLDGVRGLGPVLLAALALGVFALAVRLFMVARSLHARAAGATPPAARHSSPPSPSPSRRPSPRRSP